VREYPRAYRHHIDHAEYRLHAIYTVFEKAHAQFARRLGEENRQDCFEIAVSDQHSKRVYWEFESFLTAMSTSLDLLARICGTAFKQQAPASFKDFCKNAPESALRKILRSAQDRWAQGMKDYRDCFIHYTPADTILSLSLVRYWDGCELRAKLPSNPKAREILRFRWARRNELLRYSLRVWTELMAVDRAVAVTIESAYLAGEYPARTSQLFLIGRHGMSGKPKA
jgi:hypothetical protein